MNSKSKQVDGAISTEKEREKKKTELIHGMII
jgi:hypothetical protein